MGKPSKRWCAKQNLPNKAFKSDSQRLAVSLRSSIAKRRSHLNAALGIRRNYDHGNTDGDSRRCHWDLRVFDI
ncbi:hypothetical protein GA102_22525 [Vibrio alginolyticus]|nr:hypothetical protein [Vibrio alginolyticus]